MTQPRPDNLALVFQEIFTAIARLQAGRQAVPDAETFRAQVRQALQIAERDARAREYTAEDTRLAIFAVVALLDETVLGSRNPAFQEWHRRPLQEELFGGHVAGETFFQNLQGLFNRPDSPQLADILEVHLLCLLLGYRGRYGLGREGDLKAITDRVGEKIRRIRGSSPLLTQSWMLREEKFEERPDPWIRRLAFAAGGTFVLALVLFLVYKLSLGSGVSALQAISAGGRS